MLGGEVAGLAPVGVRVVKLPDVVVEGGELGNTHDPGRAVLGYGGPSLVVDAAVAHHLEVLGRAPLGGACVVEGIGHADALDRLLLGTVDKAWLGQPSGLKQGGGDVDHVMELAAHLAFGGDASGPVHDQAVAGAAPVRGDLLSPLERRAHCMRPTDGVVVERVGAAEVVQPREQVLGGLEVAEAVRGQQLVESAIERALS